MLPFIDSMVPQGNKLFEKAQEFAGEKKISDLNNLKKMIKFIYSAAQMTTSLKQ